MDCAAVRELMPDLALGLLEPPVEADVLAHTRECADCDRILRGYRAVARRLSAALPPQSPFHLDRETETRIHARVGGPAHDPSRRLLAAAAACLLLLAAVGAGYQLGRFNTPNAVAGPSHAGTPEEQAVAFDVIDSSRTTGRVLRSTDGSAAYGKLWTRSDMPDVVAMVNRLPASPPGSEYQLWCESASMPAGMRKVGTLSLDPEGFGMIVYKEDRQGPAYQLIEVVLQPAGAAADQGRIVLTWTGAA